MKVNQKTFIKIANANKLASKFGACICLCPNALSWRKGNACKHFPFPNDHAKERGKRMNLIDHISNDIFAMFGAIVSILSLVGLLVGAVLNLKNRQPTKT